MTQTTVESAQSVRLIPRLPRAATIILAGDALSALGSGMSLPFMLVYLHQVRGIAIATAALALSSVALASFVGNPVGGFLSDRFGPRSALLVGLVFSAAGAASLGWVTCVPVAFLAAVLLGLGNSISWPAFDALLATVVATAQRSPVFAVRHATLNAGIAVGALVAGLVVDMTRPATFQVIYLIDAATFLLFIPLLLLVSAPSSAASPPAEHRSPGYGAVLRDRLLLSVVGLSALVVMVGFSQYHAAFPGWATRDHGIPASALGICFAANAATVVVLQLPVLRALAGRTRTAAISIACTSWALAWILALVSGHTGSGWQAIGGFVATMVMFGIAETTLAPTLTAIVNDLAPEDLRGRYNAVSALGWTTGFFVGPALTGVAFGTNHGTALMALLIVTSLLGAFWATRLGRRLPASANRIGM
ncbi:MULTISPECIES: MFS transporter [unclassified Mycolicibacterium]|uniref:MFS transporter n=1 Tax=unclassified Mycolicibacterium TaxID=2636767 RepID=UPI002ED7C7CF